MNNFEKILILSVSLVVIIYFLYHFDLHKLIISTLNLFPRESFESYLWKPNQLFRNQGKIFLLDTQRVLEPGKNPLIFNTDQDYQKYILSLEKDFKEKLNLKINKKTKNIENIKSHDIPELDLPQRNKSQVENIDRFPKQYNCLKKATLCRVNPNFETILDPQKLKDFQKKHCQKNIDHRKCQMTEWLLSQEDTLNQLCYEPEMNLPEFKNDFSLMCDAYDKIKHNRHYLEKNCLGKDTYEEYCELEDFFRENSAELNSIMDR